MKSFFSLTVATALMLGLVSCSSEIENDINGNVNAAVQFSFKTNKGNLVTRAIANDDEMALSTVDIYAFSGGNRLGDGKLALGDDIKLTTGTGTINYAATPEWLNANVGKTVNFYFVANDASSVGGSHMPATVPATEAAFVELITNDVTKTGDLYNKIVPDLLFSQAVKGIQLTGKVQKEVTLSRRVARFDIVNELYNDFTVNKIKVYNANVNGYIFGDATGQSTINTGDHVEFPGLTASDYNTTDPDEIIAESVFYLYPTTIGTAAGGKTEILINATIVGETDNYLVKTDMEIKANHRYKIILDPLELEFYIVPGDWEGDTELETGFGKDTKIKFSDVSTDYRLNTANNVFQFNYSDPVLTTFTFKTTTTYGTRARINYIEGAEDDLDIKLKVQRTSVTNYDDLKTVDSYTITIPQADEGKFNIEVEIYVPGNPDVKKVYYFKRDIWNGALKTKPDLDAAYVYKGKTYEVYKINEGSQLAWFASEINNKTSEVQGKGIVLTNDIDLGNEAWTPVGNQKFTSQAWDLYTPESEFIKTPLFTGSILGNGFTVSNINTHKQYGTGRGLFAQVIGTGSSSPVIIDDVHIKGITVSGYGKWSGALVGYVRDVTQIANCSVENAVISVDNNAGFTFGCGGLVGFISSTDEILISNCSTKNIEFTGNAGWNNAGFIGKMVGNKKVTIKDCKPSEGFCKTSLALGRTLTNNYGAAPFTLTLEDGYANSWFIGNLTRTNNMEIIINNVKDNSANWVDTDSYGTEGNIVKKVRANAFEWPYIVGFDNAERSDLSASIIINGVTVTLP